ncbi:sphingolipid delta(4)-desaturase/C4-monooxygenase DES2-like isoform X3 [Pomacea canaliculata]|uniref:sphingolipid delta(4)-desaturase/C4-monooxygenase DES2-like isoform X3 n=1 Tax=Pomacea canaliculata TaxID=400727 RepID=UPI000D738E7D|nr:sphingolipid delta(4)-desaturase/C4-monooxygenase DES2-like isoform X3 [Pomacea canaliculata]
MRKEHIMAETAAKTALTSGNVKQPFKWFHNFLTLDFKVGCDNDDWLYTEEPHTCRRKEILLKHPEIKQLMGYDYRIAYIVSVEVIAQILVCWMIQDASWPVIFILAYCLGGTLNHSLGSAIHEIGHNLAFGHGRGWLNRLLSVWCNLPIAVPMAISYKKYHADHHRYLGEEFQDVDIPTRLEAWLFRHPLTKMVWLFFHPLFHALRPFYKSPKPITGWEAINAACQLVFDYFILRAFGVKPLVYLVAGTMLGLGLHPLAGHFISEHYLFSGGQATHSYYGPLNFILFNVGYHNEHHDFPYIPYTRLPDVRRLAPEYYDNLPYHSSWVKVIWDFIFDKNMGPHAHGVGYLKDEAIERNPNKDKIQ